ncbi:zinc ribbon domain-containing protein [Okeania sp. SIO3I5]|uniref:zinc ribbon domain-containing protein n=1 Tax=Okeania sp. SIO3I5 TaxID=2607805 RepID=UPI0025E7A73A|nr:zinc ribbon domain-containing protein [Okeania sp. SIO3I5]
MVGNLRLFIDGKLQVMHCSNCGFKGGEKELNIRGWTSLNCGLSHDRDVNAAIDILEVFKPKAKVEIFEETVTENPVLLAEELHYQLSLFNEVAVRVTSRREGVLVDYLSDTEEASGWLASRFHNVSTYSESFVQLSLFE